MRADAAENTEHALNEKRRLYQPPLDKMRQRIQVTDIVALDLEPSTAFGARAQNVLYIADGVAEEAVAGALEILAFPAGQLFVPVEHRIESKIHRAHVERGHLRPKYHSGPQPFLNRHGLRSAGRNVDHDIASLANRLQERLECFGSLIGAAGYGVARMKMYDGRTRIGGADCRVGNLFRRNRQIRGHRRRMDAPGYRTGDDRLVDRRHGDIV